MGLAGSLKYAAGVLLFSAAFPFILPGFLFRMLRRGGYARRLADRFGIYPPDIIEKLSSSGERPVWVHAVSVGEVQVAGQLMREWRKVEPGVRFCLSTTSSTGWSVAAPHVGPQDVLVYSPLDFPNFVKSAFKIVRPRALVLAEGEIWPVMIRTARKYGARVFLANARMSDRSAPRYRAARWFFGDVFRMFSGIYAQSELDAARFAAAGADPRKIKVTGSFKFDFAEPDGEKAAEMLRWTGGGKILLGGSTWPGEDSILLDIYSRLPENSGVKLVIAPRHFEKADAVEANILKAGFRCVRRTRGESAPADGAVLLADTTGELAGLYQTATAVFVGKSICAKGSQNMIEPCACGKPVAVGPHVENFRPVMADLLAADAIVQVSGAEELGEVLRKWLLEGDGGLGARAAEAVRRRRGATARTVAAIREVMS